MIIVILGMSAGIANSRVVRSAVIGIKENDYFHGGRGDRRAQTSADR